MVYEKHLPLPSRTCRMAFENGHKHPPIPPSEQVPPPPPQSNKRPNMAPPLRDPPLRRPPLHDPRQQTLPPRLPPRPRTDPARRQRPMSRRLGRIVAHHPPRDDSLAGAGGRTVIVLSRSCRVLLPQCRFRGSGRCVRSQGRFYWRWCRCRCWTTVLRSGFGR